MRRVPKSSQRRRPRRLQKNRQEDREDILRPSPYLGYDRDHLALYLMSLGAHKIAESQFRRAIWLNPFEPAFKVHLAECLYYMHRDSEARELAVRTQEENPDSADCRKLIGMIDERLTMI